MKKFITLVALAGSLVSFAQNRMTPELLWKIKRIGGIQVSPDHTQILFSIRKYDLSTNKSESDLYTIPVKGGKIKQITNTPGTEGDAQWRPDGEKIGFIWTGEDGRNIYEMNPDGSGIEQISEIKSGVNGFKYSPKGDQLVFVSEVKMEKVHSTEYADDLPMSDARVIDDLMYRHWGEWEDGWRSHLFIANIENGKVVGQGKDITFNEIHDVPIKPFGGMEQINWSADGRFVVYAAKKKKGYKYALSTNSNIFIYNTLLNTTQNFTNANKGYDMNPAYSSDGKLAWLAMEQDGFEADKNDIIVYDNSQLKTNITADMDITVSDFCWGADGSKLYFKSVTEATYQLYEYDFETKKATQLTEGIHNYTSIAFAGDYLIGGRQSMNHPTDIYSVKLKNNEQKQLTDINKDIYEGLETGKIEKRWVNTTDGKKELVWVIYPPGFDETKKYPAILYCQGGPQSAVSQFFSYRWNFQLMAANDYIIIAPNRRGLPGFGQEWNDAISRDWGGQPMDDYLSAVDSLKKEPYIDEERIGAVGASYGGYSVYYLAGIHENRFKTFISHCGLFNLESWYGTTEELFFANQDIGGPYFAKHLKAEYEKNSPHKLAANWDTPMLIFHGEKDFRVPLNQGLEAFQLLQLKRIESKMILFPDENHWVLSPQNGVFWHREFYAWLDKYLK